MKKTNLLWGCVFIILGAILGLNALEVTNINLFFDGWWTLFIIIPSFIDLFKDEDKTGNIIGLFLGMVLLFACQDIIQFDFIWKLFIPFVFILIGLSFIFKGAFFLPANKKIQRNNITKEYYSTFSSQTISFKNEKLENFDINAIFGGMKCDLKEAILSQDAVIHVSAIFGGVTIYVPENVSVKVSSTSIFGGVSNKSKNKETSQNTIYIQATCMFGGVEIQ